MTDLPFPLRNNRLGNQPQVLRVADPLYRYLSAEALSNGFPIVPGFNTDSVDGDDGALDGSGNQGHSFFLKPQEEF